MCQGEPDLEARQRQPLEHSQHVLVLGALGSQELAARRHVEEQVAHLDARSRRMRGRCGARERAVTRLDTPGVLGLVRSRREREPRHGSDAGQRLAAKSQGGDALEIIERCDLAGRVPGEREADFLRLDPDPVVTHPNEPAAAALELNVDARGAGIERVLHELLDHGGGTLDHLAGGNLVDELVVENLDGQGHLADPLRGAHFRTARRERR